MKKVVALVLALAFVLGLVGCSQDRETDQSDLAVYSFCGENAQFQIINGIIVISADEEVFYGGDLEVIADEYFSDIASYSTTFYTLTNGEERTIMSNSVVDQTGGSINISGDLGKMCGRDIIIGSRIEIANELKNNLYFELNTKNLNGEQNTYQVQLTVAEITDTK